MAPPLREGFGDPPLGGSARTKGAGTGGHAPPSGRIWAWPKHRVHVPGREVSSTATRSSRAVGDACPGTVITKGEGEGVAAGRPVPPSPPRLPPVPSLLCPHSGSSLRFLCFHAQNISPEQNAAAVSNRTERLLGELLFKQHMCFSPGCSSMQTRPPAITDPHTVVLAPSLKVVLPQ